MKKFLINVFCCGGAGLVAVILVLIVRVILSQGKLNVMFSVPDGTKVICIGNSHTGCTWCEAPEFRNRVLWSSGTGFATTYMRFREFERRGVFDRGVQFCILDCDAAGLAGFRIQRLQKDLMADFPFSWRYCKCLPLSVLDAVSYVLCHPFQEFSFGDVVRVREVPDWTKRTKDEQKSNIIQQYGKTSPDWKTGYQQGWEDVFLWMVGDMKKRCEAHGVRLICFASPLTCASPQRAVPKRWEWESRMIECVKALSVEYYDFRCSCADNLFLDSHHLLNKSSYDFTKRFWRDVLKLSIQN